MTVGTQENPIIMGSNGVALDTVVAPVTPTVEVAPVIAPVQAPVAAAPQAALLDAPAAVATFIPTGVSQIDDIANLLSTSKVDGKEGIIKNVLATGTLSIADQIAISATLGDSAATLIQNSLNSYTQGQADAATTETSRIKDYANGKFEGKDSELTWNQLQAYASENVPAEQRSELNTMLQSGGLSAQMAVDHIYNMYSGGNTPSAPKAQRLEGNTGANSGFVPLSKSDYSQQVAVLVETHGYDSHQVRALQQRRQVSAQSGY